MADPATPLRDSPSRGIPAHASCVTASASSCARVAAISARSRLRRWRPHHAHLAQSAEGIELGPDLNDPTALEAINVDPRPGRPLAGRGVALEWTGMGAPRTPDQGDDAVTAEGLLDGVFDVRKAGQYWSKYLLRDVAGAHRGEGAAVIGQLRAEYLVERGEIALVQHLFEPATRDGCIVLGGRCRTRRLRRGLPGGGHWHGAARPCREQTKHQ